MSTFCRDGFNVLDNLRWGWEWIVWEVEVHTHSIADMEMKRQITFGLVAGSYVRVSRPRTINPAPPCTWNRLENHSAGNTRWRSDLAVRRWTGNQYVVGSVLSSHRDNKLRNNLGQVVHFYLPLSSSGVSKYWSKDGDGDIIPLWQKTFYIGLQKVMTAYPRGWLKKTPAGWLLVHRDQLWAQRSVASMGELTF